ncbi:site-specific integrase [Oscillospiraceae bacterium OttesenSCG-928-G22]|nr:site-specific integrase [Oscillospiraceae bacterium OttesenSCG-928-G22]
MAKRRFNGEGSFYKLPNDKGWQYKKTVGYTDEGRPLRKSFYGKTQPEAKAKCEAWEKENEGAVYAVSPDTRLKQWLDIWLVNTKQGTLRESSYKDLERMCKAFPPALLKKKVSKISPIELQNFINTVAASGKSESYVGKIFTLIRGAFSVAQDNGLCVRNPAAKLNRPNIRQAPREAYTATEASTIVSYALAYKNAAGGEKTEADRLRISTAIVTLLFTGLRRGELLGLMWSDITPEKIQVNRAVFIDGGSPKVEEFRAKTVASLREVPIPAFLYDLIQTLPKKSLYIFGADSGALMNPHNFNRAYKRFFENLKKEHPDFRLLTPHCLRHPHVKPGLKNDQLFFQCCVQAS